MLKCSNNVSVRLIASFECSESYLYFYYWFTIFSIILCNIKLIIYPRKSIKSALPAPRVAQVWGRMLGCVCALIHIKLSSIGRKWKHCLQRCYEVSLNIGSKRMLLKFVWCIRTPFMDIFGCLSWSDGTRWGYLISEVTGSSTAALMWGFTQVPPAPASFILPKLELRCHDLISSAV